MSRKLLWLRVCVIACVAATASPAVSADYEWAGSGHFNDSLNWINTSKGWPYNGVPGIGDTATITVTGAAFNTAELTGAAEVATLNLRNTNLPEFEIPTTLWVNAFHTSSLGILKANEINIDHWGKLVITHDGRVEVDGALNVGYGGGLFGSVHIGNYQGGSSKGHLTADDIMVGRGDAADGRLVMTDGSITTNWNIHLGDNGAHHAHFESTAGDIDVGHNFYVENHSWSLATRTVHILGGVLDVKNDLWVSATNPGSAIIDVVFNEALVRIEKTAAFGCLGGSGSTRVNIGGVLHVGGDVLITDTDLGINQGFLLATGSTSSDITVRGSSTLTVSGSESVVAATGDFDLGGSTLAVVITSDQHTPIRVGRDAIIEDGSLEVRFVDYEPDGDEHWVLLEAGSDLLQSTELADQWLVDNDFDFVSQWWPAVFGDLIGEFASVNVPEGYELFYFPDRVVLAPWWWSPCCMPE